MSDCHKLQLAPPKNKPPVQFWTGGFPLAHFTLKSTFVFQSPSISKRAFLPCALAPLQPLPILQVRHQPI